MSTTKEFKKIVLGFDEAGFASKMTSLENGIITRLNTAIESLEELDLKMTDAQLSAYFRNKDLNPGDILIKHFNKVPSKFERERLIEEYRNELHYIMRYASSDNHHENELQYVQFKNGKAELNPEAVEKLKAGFYRTLDSERAKFIHDLHEDIFSKTEKLLEFLREKHAFAKYHDLFEMDQEWNLRKPKFDYNKL